ncbi:farnesol dehydrogenase-like [Ceratina calcarata]|uniref:Farnesol dehydrogenase-like n=1 Tax=Ceratina calcarata TaxID=156304 RepID=A0AAJ7NDF7_9HYME|nr:farnesol dehydrogenase-like [Ceratina calcarata]
MEQWSDKVALITCASSGVGKCLAESMVNKGMKVICMANQIDKMKSLAEELKSKSGKLLPLQCDLANQNDIARVMDWIEKNLGAVDILINNAALSTDNNMIQNSNMEDWKKIMDTNLVGLASITKEVLKLMKKQGINNGIIVNINDALAQKLPNRPDRPLSPANIVSKAAQSALTELLRMELAQQDSNIKVISISPGLVETEQNTQWLKENGRQALKPRDVADCILLAIQTPNNVLIKEMIITPLREML